MIKTIGLFLLLLLKTLGILLLVLLLLLLAVLLLVLLVPVRYRAVIVNEKNEDLLDHNLAKHLNIQVTINWLLHFLHVCIYYDTNGLTNTIQVAGIDLRRAGAWFSRRKEAKQIRKAKKLNDAKKLNAAKHTNTEDAESIAEPSVSDNKQTEVPVSDDKKTEVPVSEMSNTKTSVPETATTDRSKDNFTDIDHAAKDIPVDFSVSEKKQTDQKHRTHKKKIQSQNQSARKTSQNKGEKKEARPKRNIFRTIQDKFRQFHKEFTDETNRNSVLHLWKELCFLMRNYKPRKMEADICYSLADPAITGEILAGISLMPFVYRYPCSILPDFTSEQVYIEGRFMVEGKITAGLFVVTLVRLIRDKEFMQVVRRFTKRDRAYTHER